MYVSDQAKEAMLYYLFMMSDGEVSNSEKKFFDKICRKIKIDEDDKKYAIDNCKGLANNHESALDVIISKELDKEVGFGWLGFKKDDSTLAKIIWNLVDLGYADTDYSENEREIVNYLVEKWEIKTEVYQEMVDTAETILALVKQKEWLDSTFPEDSLRKKKIDSEIKTMLSDIKLTIDELTM